MAIDLKALLIGQWQNSPRMCAIADIIIAIRDNALEALDRIELMQAIDHAEGVWLDVIGARMGVPRPATTDPSQDTRFGFDDAGVGFDLAPFRGTTANDAVYPLPDAAYRRLLRAAARVDVGDGTEATFARAAREIDPTSTVIDNRDMTVTVVTDDERLMRIADAADVLGRPSGVSVDYRDRSRFGFDDAGLGFDQGPFRGV